MREAAPRGATLQRFNLFHRINHAIAMVGFTTAVVTGMPLKYADERWAQGLMRALGGVERAGLLHRTAAVLIGVYFVLELGWLLVGLFRTREPLFGPLSIVPSMQDVRDVGATLRWFRGRGPRPAFGRFTYWEKFDYWALMIGTAVIGTTGLIMWFPTAVTRYLPGLIVNVALVIHSNEALLAFGTIFIFVHIFHAHFRPEIFPFDPVIFSGRVPVDEVRAYRPRECEALFGDEAEEPAAGPDE